MRHEPDENDQLASLLRALPAPAPSAQFLSAARHRYLEAIEARARREVFTGLMVALVGLAVIGALLGPIIEPSGVVAWLAEATADVARWTTGVGVVLALVPPVVWTSVVLGFAATVLSLMLIARARSLALAK
jgi:hypothetical protein